MAKRFSENVRRLFTFFVVTLLMLGSIAAPGKVAAQAQTVQSQLTGVTISYGPPYSLAPELGFADESVEMIGFTGAADILTIGFMNPLIDLTAARDIVLESLFGETVKSANIDRGSYTGVSYSLDMLNLDGDEMGVFTLFMNQRSHGFSEFYIFIAPPALFGGTMVSAQNSVSINGVPVLDGIDATVMGNMVMANVGITGGTAVTDVTEVTQPATTGTTGTTQTTTTGTTQTTGSTQATTGDADARAAYLDAVLAEYNNGTEQLSTFLETLDAMGNDQITGEEALPLLNGAMENLAGTNDRVAAIQPPPGMEAFHQQFLSWAGALTNAGVVWANYRQDTATADDHFAAMNAAIDAHQTFGANLDAERSAAPTETTGQTTQTTAQPTQAPQTTGTTATTTGDADARTQYLKAVEAEFLTANQSLTDFGQTMDAMEAEETTIEEARPIVNGAMESLAGTSDRAAAIQPPAGMEDFHQEFLAWADAMTNVGAVWQQFLDGTATADDHWAAFQNALDVHNAFADVLIPLLQADQGQTTEAPQTTGDTGATSTGATTASNADSAEYLAAVRTEYEIVTVQLVMIVTTVKGMNDGSITSEQGVADLNEANMELVASAERSAAIQPPAGMEAFHQQFLDWNQAVADTGAAWVAVTQGGEVQAWEDALNNLLDQNETFGTALEAEEAASTSSGTTTTGTTGTTQTTGTTRTTGSTQTTASTGGNEEYLAAVRAEYDLVGEQITTILDTLDAMGAGTITADQGRADIAAANDELMASAQRTAALQPPAGMEEFHQSVMAWQQSVQATADAWVVVTQGGDSTAYVNAFNAMVEQQNILGPLLGAQESVSGSSGTTTTATTGTASETPTATEATGTTGSTRTTRTTRSTGTASETATATETTGSTRTTRTTRSTGTTTTATNTGNSSETSGNTGTTGTSSTGGDSWLTPQNNLTITWNDPFLLDERDEDLPKESDESDGTDILRLYWAGPQGQEVGVFVTVYPIDQGDASDRVTIFTDPAVLVDTFGEGTELIDSVSSPEQGAILARLDIPNADIWVYMQYTCADASCSQMISVMIVTSGENMSAVLGDMEQSVDVEGMPISNAMTPADVQSAIDSAGP